MPAISQADESPVRLEENNQWIFGRDINSFTCVSLNSKNQSVYLQVLIKNKWVNKAKGRKSVDLNQCGSSSKSYYINFNWKVDVKGQINSSEKFSKKIKLRIYIPKYGNNPEIKGKTLVKNLYASLQDWDKYVEDQVIQLYNEWLNNEINSAVGTSSSQASKLGGCIYRNKQLFGKVKIVDYGADFKIQLVDYGADLKVRKVDYGANKCGVWQFVDYGADFKVQIVDFGSDFKVQFVEYGEGL